MSSEISSMFYGAVLHVNKLNVNLYTNPHSWALYCFVFHRYENTLIYIAYVTCVCTYDAHKCGQIVNITHRRFEQVLCNIGRVGKTERLIIYFNKHNFSANLPRKTSTNSSASSTSDVSCRSNPNVSSYCANTNMSSEISSMLNVHRL
jgi:hypothetical protein